MHTAPTRTRRTITALTATALTAALCTGGFAGSALAAPAAPTVATAAPDVVELTIAEASDLLGSKQTTSVALVHEYFARIAAYDVENTSGTDLNAIIAINEDAKAQAIALDAERAAGHVRGPLHGVPIVVKDNIDLKGMATTNGAISFASYKPKNDSTVVKKLQAAGAIIIAKTNLSEFAWSGSDAKSGLGGEVLNPYDLTKTSSGSSGGTAAAVAASFATAGLGTDTYGSIRNPSGNQSLVGVRPTHGLVSLAGVTAQIAPLDTVGPMTKSVEDAAIILDAIAGYDKNDPYTDDTIGQVPESYVSELSDTSLEGTKILYLTNSRFHGAGSSRTADLAEVDALEEAAFADFEAQGATVERVELTSAQLTSISGRGWVGFAKYLDEFLAENDAYWPKGLAAKAAPTNKLTTADYIADGQETPQIAPDAEWLLSTANVSDSTLATQQTREDNARAAWAALLDEYDADAVAFPNDALPASDVTEDPSGYSDSATNADLASGLGAPAIALPVGFTAAGLPVSLQLTGALYSEASLLSYAYDYEQATQKRVAPTTTPELVHETPVVTPPKSKAMSITVKATGSTRAGKKAGVAVKASRGGSAVSGTTVTYKWRVGGKVVATTRTLTLKKAWVGKAVKVSVIAKKSGYTSVSKTTTVVAKVRKG